MMIYGVVFFTVTLSLMILSAKWELDRKIAFPWAILMGILSCSTIALIKSAGYNLHPLPLFFIAGSQAVILSLIAILILFFRNPERTPPAREDIIVSPADGIIKYVKEIHNNEFPFALKNKNTIPLSEFVGADIIAGNGIQIGIGMSLLDVHVNRSPIAGKISFLRRIPGAFNSLKNINSLLENERVAAIIEGRGIKIGIVLIASRLVRRICMYLSEGKEVAIGQRIGMIRFGSQVDIIMPVSRTLKINVKPGDNVKAGASILATL
jgi:phosphatidylserine decarboxylase